MKKMTLLEIILLGRKYLSLWPERKELINYFAEYHSILVSRFVCRYSKFFGVFIIALPYAANIFSYLNQSIVSALFILSMPIQVYIMLGLQADKYLPPSLASWYREGVAKVKESSDIKLTVSNPKYLDLVNLLNLSYR